MSRYGWIALTASLLLSVVVALAADAPTPSADPDRPAGEGRTAPPCQIDERLSLWLSLEAADRTISALDRERRELAVEREQLRKQLELLYGSSPARGEDLADFVARVGAEAVGESAFEESYSQIDLRIVEIDRTLQQRRELAERTEQLLESLLEPAEGRR